jgi:hypothetical protein
MQWLLLIIYFDGNFPNAKLHPYAITNYFCQIYDHAVYNNIFMDIKLSSHLDTLCWFRANQYLIFLLNAAYLTEKQKIPILQSFVWPAGAQTHEHSHANLYAAVNTGWLWISIMCPSGMTIWCPYASKPMDQKSYIYILLSRKPWPPCFEVIKCSKLTTIVNEENSKWMIFYRIR